MDFISVFFYSSFENGTVKELLVQVIGKINRAHFFLYHSVFWGYVLLFGITINE